MFYSVMASTIFFAAVCWGAGIKAQDANRLDKLIKKEGCVGGFKPANLEEAAIGRKLMETQVWALKLIELVNWSASTSQLHNFEKGST